MHAMLIFPLVVLSLFFVVAFFLFFFIMHININRVSLVPRMGLSSFLLFSVAAKDMRWATSKGG
jgi:hypothetical protein